MSRRVDIKEVLKENQRRTEELFAPYDPVKGIGSPLERFEFPYSDDEVLHLPVTMKDSEVVKLVLEVGSFKQLAGGLKKKEGRLLYRLLEDERCKHDFEYWAYKSIKIQDKTSEDIIPFKLRRPQRKVLEKCEKMRLGDIPIRIIILKARQWGGSTFVQIYMMWIQMFHKKNWNSAIIADVDDQAKNIRHMFSVAAQNYPKDMGSITLKPYEGSTKNKVISERGCVIGVGSVQNPDNLRSYNFSMVHMSEVGLWKSTPQRSAESVAQSMRGGVSQQPYSFVAMESTAKGVGNFFHREWQSAESGKSAYEPIFVAFFEIDIYFREIDDKEDFIRKMTEEAWYLWDLGATLESINWYFWFKESENWDDWRMMSEFPPSAKDAFQSTGQRVFPPSYVMNLRRTCQDPMLVGDIFGRERKGKAAFEKLRIEPVAKGNLKVWAMPDKSIEVTDRYCGFMDIGGTTSGADFTEIIILDRYWRIDGGVSELVALWHGHLDQDLAAWKAAQLAYIYNTALLGVEVNSLRKEQAGSEGEHSLTVLDEIAEHYPNLYSRTNPEQIKKGIPNLYGFHTNTKTKPMIINTLKEAARENLYIEKEREACDQMDTYEVKEDGSMGAVEGCKDDKVITRAGALWLDLKYLDLPRIVDVQPSKKRKKKIIGEATF